MARRSKYSPEKRRKLPEPRYRKRDEFEELTRDDTAEKFFKKSDTGEGIREGPAIKGFGLRRSRDPFEAAKQREEEEESLREPEYGKGKRTKRRLVSKRK